MKSVLESQLQVIRSSVNPDTDPQKRPFTRPSILFDAKQAADIDIDTLFNLALSGLEVLVSHDERFANYKNDLFTLNSRELDRELMGIDQNNQINASISSYLRLLSGYFQLPSALRTLEYLIRRYKIHKYNIEELILCSLPYHDTHVFVRIVQLLETGNGKWEFLNDVKTSGAPPPRKTIVQKCSSDVLVAICDYASPSKKIQPTRPVISFCTAVIIELYGSKTEIISEDVKKILPYLRSFLQSRSNGSIDHKAGALMIIGLLANRSELNYDVSKSLMRPIAGVAREDAKHSTDLQLFRVSFMALVSIVQTWQRKPGEMLPKKVLDVLNEIRDLSGILCGLTKEFNIDKFLALLLESLMEYSPGDDKCHQMLLSMIKTVPINPLVERLVSKLLSTSTKLYKKGNEASSSAPGSKVKEILVSIKDHYSRELREAVQSSLEDIEMKSKRDGSAYDILCKALDGDLDSPSALSDSRIWFGLEHPKARVRRATVLSLDADLKLGDKSVNTQKLQTVNDALLRRLYDDDLSVVQAVLSMDRLSEFIKHLDLLDGLQKVLKRCISILNSKGSDNTTLAADVTVSCLEHVISSFQHQEEYAKELAAMIFPLILVMPKSQSISLKALNAAKNLQWPLYQKVTTIDSPEQKMVHKSTAALNMDNINVMAESFLVNSDEYVQWFVGYCHDLDQSKTLFFLILLQSLMKPLIEFCQFSALYGSCFPILIKEWEKLETAGVGAATAESNRSMLDRDCTFFLDQMYGMKVEELNAEILICIFWRLLDSFIATAYEDVSQDESDVILQNLFSFFASHSKVVYKMHLHHLVAKQKNSPARFLSSLFTGEGVAFPVQKESLHSFAFLCSQLEEECRLKSEVDEGLLLQLPTEFPSLLVPLSSDDQEIRSAAMSCIEVLYTLWPHVSSSGGKNGRSAVWGHFLGELMAMMVQQKKLILSDIDFLFEFFTTLLSSTHHSLLVPKSVGDRFDRPTKDSILKFIVGSALSLCPYGMLKVLSLLKSMGSHVMLVKEVTSLLSDLLDRRNKSRQMLSHIEVKILCLLLECCTKLTSTAGGQAVELHMLKALQVDCSFSEDVSIIEPCATVLRCLSSSLYGGFKPEIQELFFQELVCLFRSYNSEIQNAARMALSQLKVSSLTIQRMLDFVLEKVVPLTATPLGKKKKKATTHLKSELHNDADHKRCSKLFFLSSLLDILLLKIDIQNRTSLVEPLFKHLNIVFMDKEWISEAVKQDEEHAEGSVDVSQSTSSTICYIQQNLLSVLEDIANDKLEARIVESFDIKLLVCCARSTDDAATRNHVFSLLSAVAKVVPDIILDHIRDILTVMCESAVTQFDGHSKKVFEDLISTMVPHWLSKTKNQEELLQIFLNILPDVSQHRRLSIIMHLLRTLGESSGLASIFVLLFRSLASKYEHLSTSVRTMWEYTYALQISEQYSCIVWLPSLLTMLQKIEMGTWDQRLAVQLLVAMQFISEKLQAPEIAFKLKSGEDVDTIQATSSALMEHVATYLQLVGSSRKEHDVQTSVGKKLKELLHDVLTSVRKGLLPSSFFDVISKLLGHADRNLRKKGLRLLSDMAKECSTLTQKHNKRVLNPSIRSSWLHFDELTLQSFENMCHEILKIVDDTNASKHGSLRLSAVSTLEVLVTVFPTCDSIFNICLSTVIKHIHSDDLGVSSGCFRTVGALINVLGPRALPELPSIMDNVFQRCNAVSLCVNLENRDTDISLTGPSSSKESLFMSILVTIEAVIEKLGGFLNPYLGKVLELVILRPQYANDSSLKLKLKADGVRNLITEKVPVRLSLPPLLRIYSEAIKSGDSGLSITFQMLGNLISKMDRSSISIYYLNIFDLCLLALDLRRQHPASVNNITAVEKDVINAMAVLTMKLTENMFKPLFIRCVEWSEFVEQSDDLAHADVDRAISFFSLVHKLIDSHRSLFVPYFKYILNGLACHLTDEVARPGPTRKKAKLMDLDIIKSQEHSSLSIGKWHVRALVISSLHKCFLYDAGNLEFLDSTNFQLLLKPVISQLGVDPPSSLEEHPDVPSVNEVDDMLVSCVGQMAVTSASDLLWKPLNHEVLMHTRSEKVRTRILGLKIVKYLVENLREEYLVFLPETIPFLGELLEDVEPNVKSLAQEILKEIETTSGESLKQYL